MKKAIIILVIIIFVAVAAFILWARNELNTPVQHQQAEQYIEIPRGSSSFDIVSKLGEAGVIRRGWVLGWYIRLTGTGPRLKAGEYRFPSPISPLGVLRKLEEGQQRLSRLTVIEGWTRWDVAALLVRIPELKLQSNEEALALLNDTAEIRDLDPTAQNLEGYLYPDTYSFPPNTSAKEVVSSFVRRFRQVWGEAAAKGGAHAGRPVREILTVASLVETEAKLAEERPLVASVIYNRLRVDMPLGIDSTVIYASKLAGKWRNDGKVYMSDLERDSPYNTRKVRGLPPGPIASPGARSIEAALNPAQSDYLYYVREPSRDDGAHNFYSSSADFERGVQALRAWERSRNANAGAAPTPSGGTDVPANQ